MAAREGSNSFDGAQIETYLRAIAKADDRLMELKVAYTKACKGPRSSIRNILKEARDIGLNMAALRTVIARDRAGRKIEQRISELEPDDAADYEAMQEALGAFGDTDLGQAALRKAKPKGGSEKLDTLHS